SLFVVCPRFRSRWIVYRSLFVVRSSISVTLNRPSFPFCCSCSVSVTLDRLSFPFCCAFLRLGHVGSSIVPFLLCVPLFGSRWIVHRSLFVVLPRFRSHWR